MENIGFAAMQVIPSFRGVEAAANRELAGIMPRVGAQAGEHAGKGVTSGFGKAMSSLGGIAKTGALAAGAALGSGILAAGAWGLKLAAANEQAEISFTTMLGSAEKAGSFLSDLRDFAASTPFEFPELQTAASSLISAGVEADKVIPIMTSLGDATSGMGTGSEGVKRATVALQQMSAAGRITGEDLNQLRDAGIPVFDLLAAATGKTKEAVAGLAQQGKLGKEELGQLFSALESGKGLERFSGLMDKQSASLTGLASTMKDVWGQKLAEAMGPAVDKLKELAPAATDAGGALIDGVVHGAEVAGPKLQAMGGALRDTADDLWPLVKGLGEELIPIAQDVGDIAGDVLPKAWGLASGAMAGALKTATLVASGVEGVTGILSDHKEIVYGVVAGYAAWKAANAVAGITDTAKWVAFTGVIGKAKVAMGEFAAATAITSAATGMSTLSAGVTVLATMPVSPLFAVAAGVGAIAVGYSLATDSLERSAQHGKQAADDFVDNLTIDPIAIRSMADSVAAMSEQYDTAAAEADRGGRGWAASAALIKQRLNPFDKNTIDEAAGERDRLAGIIDSYTVKVAKLAATRTNLDISGDALQVWLAKLDINPDDFKVGELTTMIDDAATAARNGTPQTDALGESLGVLGDETSNSTEKFKAWAEVIDQAVNPIANAFDAQGALRTALREVTGSLATNDTDITSNTEAADQNAASLTDARDKAIDLANAWAEKTGDLKMGAVVLEGNRQAIIDAGVAAGRSQEEMESYLNAIGLTPEAVDTAVTASGVTGAKTALGELQGQLDQFDDRDYRAKVTLDIDDGGLLSILTQGGGTTIVGGQHAPTEGNQRSMRSMAGMPNAAPGVVSIAPTMPPAGGVLVGHGKSAGGGGMVLTGPVTFGDNARRTVRDLDIWSMERARDVVGS